MCFWRLDIRVCFRICFSMYWRLGVIWAFRIVGVFARWFLKLLRVSLWVRFTKNTMRCCFPQSRSLSIDFINPTFSRSYYIFFQFWSFMLQVSIGDNRLRIFRWSLCLECSARLRWSGVFLNWLFSKMKVHGNKFPSKLCGFAHALKAHSDVWRTYHMFYKLVPCWNKYLWFRVVVYTLITHCDVLY